MVKLAGVYVAAAAGVALAVLYLARRGAGAVSGALDSAGRVARDVAGAVNPASTENLAYRGVSALTAAATGAPSGSVTFGGQLFEWFNPSAVDAGRRLVEPSVGGVRASDGVFDYVRPVESAPGRWTRLQFEAQAAKEIELADDNGHGAKSGGWYVG